jgi:membrane-bound ClpP family serine protease
MGDAFWPAVFLAMGLLLVSLELFVPSGGFIGLSAVVCLGLGLWNAFQVSTSLGWTFVLIDFIAVPVTAIVMFRLWARSPMGRRLRLAPPSSDEDDVSHSTRRAEELVGSEGRALTTLRPSGHVEVRGRRHDGMAESGMIDQGSPVRVVRIRSGQLVVRPVESPAMAERPSGGEAPAGLELDLDFDVENPQTI